MDNLDFLIKNKSLAEPLELSLCSIFYSSDLMQAILYSSINFSSCFQWWNTSYINYFSPEAFGKSHLFMSPSSYSPSLF